MQEFKLSGHESSFLPENRNWKLSWHDEFDGTGLDRTKWRFRLNFWGQVPAPFYTDQGVEVKDGKLVLRLTEKDGVYSAPILQTGTLVYECPKDTDGFWPFGKQTPAEFLHSFGYYEILCRPPRKPGWWSAFWLQSPSIGAHPDPRFAGVECDIMESQDFAGRGEFRGGNIYGGYGYDAKNPGHARWIPENLHDGWFRFGVDWAPDGYTFYCDGKTVHRELSPVSQASQFILVSSEPVGSRSGKPDPRLAEALDDTFEVAYVRVFDSI